MSQLEPLPSAGKPAAQSLTIWSLAAAFAGLVLPHVLPSLHVLPEDIQPAVDAVGQIITGLGVLVAVGGRARANAPLTSLVRPKGS